MSAREQVVITVDAPAQRLPVSTDAEQHLYRIALEAMHNALKHAHPTRIEVLLTVDAQAWTSRSRTTASGSTPPPSTPAIGLYDE